MRSSRISKAQDGREKKKCVKASQTTRKRTKSIMTDNEYYYATENNFAVSCAEKHMNIAVW